MGDGTNPEEASVAESASGQGDVGGLVALLRCALEVGQEVFWETASGEFLEEPCMAWVACSGLGGVCSTGCDASESISTCLHKQAGGLFQPLVPLRSRNVLKQPFCL